MTRLDSVQRLAALTFGLLLWSAPSFAQFSVPNFTEEAIFAGDGSTALDFGPTGNLYVAEKQGIVKVATPNGQGGFNPPQIMLDLRGPVDAVFESGLLGIAVDPEHASNRHIFLFYTTNNDQRLVRYTLNPAGTSASQETVILSGLPRTWDVHKGGDIQFRPGEPQNIYISLGDDTIPNEAPSLTSHRGKMLRVDKTSGNGLSSNPYYQSGPLNVARARLFSIGMRNPFRFTFHPTVNTPASDVLYVSENGDATDKIAWVQAGSNGGWSAAGDGPFINVADPNHRVLYTGPASHIGIAIAASGPFSDGGTPVLYLSNWVNPAGGAILRWRMTGSQLDSLTPVPADNGQVFFPGYATSLRFGPDGSLYFTQSGGDESLGGFYDVGRLRYVGGNPPVARITTNPSPATGPAPLTVQFNDASSDSDGTIQGRAWDFGDGGSSSQTNPSHTYTAPGNYTAQLTVTDDDGLSTTTSVQVTAVANFTLNLNGEVRDGNFTDFRRRSGTTQLRIRQADGAPVAFPGGVGPDNNGFDVVDGTIDESLPLTLTSDEVVITAGEADGSLATQTYAFSVPSGASSHTETLILYPATTAVRGRITDTRGEPAQVDLGVARDMPSNLYEVAGGRDYEPGSGFPQTNVDHRVESDVLGYYYLPLRDPGRYYVDVVADTGRATYLATLFDENLASVGDVADRNVTIGLRSGGAGCDDLAALPETADVDYSTQIQPLWGGCIGCHRPNSPNGGGLDLTAANSFAALVDVDSTQVPGRKLVQPSDPTASYLLEKIGCDNPQVGNRMRPDVATSPADQALVRDWIAQGARAQSTTPPPDGGVPDAMTPPDAAAGPDASNGPDAGIADDAGASPAPDAGVAGVAADAGEAPFEQAIGGGCRSTGADAGPWLGVLLGALGLAWRRRG